MATNVEEVPMGTPVSGPNRLIGSDNELLNAYGRRKRKVKRKVKKRKVTKERLKSVKLQSVKVQRKNNSIDIKN